MLQDPANTPRPQDATGESALGSAGAARPEIDADARLLLLCGEGDREAYMRLYDLYSARAFGMVVAILGPGPVAQDAFQDAMWDVWRRASTYRAELGPPDAWILMIARSRGIDALRREQRFAAARRAMRHPGPPGAGPAEPGAQASDAEHAHVIAGALAALPPDQASVIRLAFLRGMSRDQIASTLGVPVGTVKTRIRTGIRTMVQSLAGGASTQGGGA